MSVKNGSTFRSVRRLAGICLAMAFALTALFVTAASARPVSKTYLAIGDSLAFGYSQQLYNEHSAAGDPATFFENGYVDGYYHKLKTHSQYMKVNLGCPGETTKSLIGNKALGVALAGAFGATNEAPCTYQEAWNAFKSPGTGGPLHVEYPGKSQAEAAIEQIAIAAGSGRPVTKVTLNIGANDELATVHGCEKEVGEEFGKEGKSKYGATPTEAVKNCLVAHLEGLIKTIITNTEAVAYALRHGGEFGGVNYTGQIIFMASYDPDGEVFHAGEGPPGFPQGEEVLPGSVPLAGLINTEEKTHFGQPFNPEEGKFGFEACTAEPLTTFNPQNRTEAHKLQTWTNMANFTKFEGKSNGPDIHPTPAGYSKLATIIKKACGN